MRKFIGMIIVGCVVFHSCTLIKNASSKTFQVGSTVKLQTSQGDIVINLYPETPKHKANFIKLAKSGFYNGVLFHRVIPKFMIQTGDPNSKNAKANAELGMGDVGYTIPSEFKVPKYYHKRGALSAARTGDEVNPKKASSGCQFYIVQGKVFTDQELDQLEQNKIRAVEDKLLNDKMLKHRKELAVFQKANNQVKLNAFRDSIKIAVHLQLEKDSTLRFSPQQRMDYKSIGGTPHLDGAYTVFGEVVEGLDIVDRISKVKTNRSDRPIVDIRILKVEIVK